METPLVSEDRPAKTGRWSEAALRVLRERYLSRQKGEVVETPEEMCWRVARAIAAAEEPSVESAVIHEVPRFYDVIVIPFAQPRTLMNAGKGISSSIPAHAPVGDSMQEIFDSVKAVIHQSGGEGMAFSRLRPKTDFVRPFRAGRQGPPPSPRLQCGDGRGEAGGRRGRTWASSAWIIPTSPISGVQARQRRH